MDLFDLTGRTALITGSSQGIGLALAEGLAAAGAHVLLNGRDRARLDAARERVPGSDLLRFDVTDGDAVRAAIDGYEASTGPIDVLVNNAGIQRRAPLHEFPTDDFERVLATNVTSVFLTAQVCARHMIPRGRGRIVNIASVNAFLARATIAPYTASKGAVVNLTKGMATDWARFGLNCNAIAPGYMRTPLNEPLAADPEFTSWLTRRTPAGRWGDPADLVGACVFLASDAAAFVNGTVITVDGGLTATL